MSEPVDLRSADVTSSRIAQILELFPEARSEGGRVDFDRLRAALGADVAEGVERFGMSWPGKAESIRAAQKQSVATLLPVPGESVDFDKTQNVIIEGDNLEVLKLLQKSYLGKVKMIYIDPPYNTGNDFIYPDNYSESLQTYLEYTGQVDEEGKRFSTNTETDGRFHSKWMSMMYPRLMLARNLLTEDGVIFISIDDSELGNLLAVCNEILGEEFCHGILTWRNKTKPVNVGKARLQIQSDGEYVVVYSRMRRENFPGFILEAGDPRQYPHQGVLGMCRLENLEKTNSGRMKRESMRFPILGIRPRDGKRWQIGEEEAKRLEASGRLEVVGERVYRVVYPQDESATTELPFWSRLDERVGTAESGKADLYTVVGDVGFDTVKPRQLIEELLVHLGADALVLDFFAGSGTTGHAVLAQNAKDGGSRRFILVQLPEPVEEGSEAAKAGFGTIADITKERVRRAAKEIAKEAGGASKPKLEDGSGPQDLGFRVFKLDKSNFRVWDAAAPAGDAAKLVEQLEMQVEHVEKGRSGMDVVFEVLLKSKLPLTSSVERENVSGGVVWSVESGRLLVVVDEGVDLAGVRELAERDPRPETVVFLDRCFGGKDSLKVNARKIFQDASIEFKTI